MENELATSITKINNSLIISLPGEMTDENINTITELIIDKSYDASVNGAILDFSKVKVLDAHMYNSFIRITKALTLMGVESVWAGLRPGVVTAIMDLGIELDASRIVTVTNLEQGLELLSRVQWADRR